MAEDLGLIVTKAVAEGFKTFGKVKGEEDRAKAKTAETEAKKLEGQEKEQAKIEAQIQQDEDDALRQILTLQAQGQDISLLGMTQLNTARAGLSLKPLDKPDIDRLLTINQQRVEEEQAAQQEEEAKAEGPTLFGEAPSEFGFDLPPEVKQLVQKFPDLDLTPFMKSLGVSGPGELGTAAQQAKAVDEFGPVFEMLGDALESGIISPEDLDTPAEQKQVARTLLEQVTEARNRRAIEGAVFGGRLAGEKELEKQATIADRTPATEKGLSFKQKFDLRLNTIIGDANRWFLENFKKSNDRKDLIGKEEIKTLADIQFAANALGSGQGTVLRDYADRYRLLQASEGKELELIRGLPPRTNESFGPDGSLISEDELEEARALGLIQ